MLISEDERRKNNVRRSVKAPKGTQKIWPYSYGRNRQIGVENFKGDCKANWKLVKNCRIMKWIDTNKELPKEGINVLVWYEEICNIPFMAVYKNTKWYDVEEDFAEIGKPSHWFKSVKNINDAMVVAINATAKDIYVPKSIRKYVKTVKTPAGTRLK